MKPHSSALSPSSDCVVCLLESVPPANAPQATDREGAPGAQWFLYVESWTLIVACFYFVLAFFLTLTAVSSAGKESASTPLPVLLCWVCYGILVPASLSCALMWIFITQSSDNNRFLSASGHPGASIGSTLFIWILVYSDMYVNRQPVCRDSFESQSSCASVLLCDCRSHR